MRMSYWKSVYAIIIPPHLRRSGEAGKIATNYKELIPCPIKGISCKFMGGADLTLFKTQPK